LTFNTVADRFLKPVRSIFALMLWCFHAPAFAALADGLVADWSFDDCTVKGNDK
jgi:hypothetical protein